MKRKIGKITRLIDGYGDRRLVKILNIAEAQSDKRKPRRNVNERLPCRIARYGFQPRLYFPKQQVRVDSEREIGHPDAELHAAKIAELRARLMNEEATNAQSL